MVEPVLEVCEGKRLLGPAMNGQWKGGGGQDERAVEKAVKRQ